MFRKVLVANRGEIACRILRTLRALGIPSVAVHHFIDRRAPHVAMADEAVELHADVPSAAYLDHEQLVRACRTTGADAVHPGYGFVSESATFAERMAQESLTFIGPSAEVLRLMGDKIRSRRLAGEALVPTSPSVTFDETSDLARAETLGFPLLIKAAAGGGGKGMKIVRDASAFAASVALARSEASRYFGDSRVYAERLLERPRHIEVQVLGDGRGEVIHLGERECSIQRRFQKIVEETPAPSLDPELRASILEAAVRIAREARYENAGTVEFIVGADKSFFFLEMNTRLQVEHPVTEMVTGLDLVAEQLRIAATKTLSLRQEDVRFRGHAIECRVCAEEPEHGYRPATGRIGLLCLPELVRVDSGVVVGQAVTAAFDSLLMKVVAHGGARGEAIERLTDGLRELAILGVLTNVEHLSRIVDSAAFREGRLHTGFLEENASVLGDEARQSSMADFAAVAAALADGRFRRSVLETPEPLASIGAYRN